MQALRPAVSLRGQELLMKVGYLRVSTKDQCEDRQRDALNELHNMRARGIEVQIASMSLDTGTPIGKLMFTFISGLAEFERDLHVTRTKEGLEATRRRGTRIGRPPKISNRQVRAAQEKLKAGNGTITELAALNGIHPWTLRRRIAALDQRDEAF